MKYLLIVFFLALTTFSYASLTWNDVKSATGVERDAHTITFVKNQDTKCKFAHWNFSVPKGYKVAWNSQTKSFLVNNNIKIHFFENPTCINMRKNDKSLTINKRLYKVEENYIINRYCKITYEDSKSFDLIKKILHTMKKNGYKSADSTGNTYVDDFLNLF